MDEIKPHGGPRPGSGRKPKLLTALLLEFPEASDDIATAYHLFRDTMRDDNVNLDCRLDAAREILNRLCGKPTQALQLTGEEGGAIEVAHTDQLALAMLKALEGHPEARVAAAAALMDLRHGTRPHSGTGDPARSEPVDGVAGS